MPQAAVAGTGTGTECEDTPDCEIVGSNEVEVINGVANFSILVKSGCDPLPQDLLLTVTGGGSEIEIEEYGVTTPRLVQIQLPYEFGEKAEENIYVNLSDIALNLFAGNPCVFNAVQCEEPVWCFLDGVDTTMRGRPAETVRMYDVRPGDVLDVMEVCALSGCGNRARVEMYARPPFMEPAGHRKGAMGEPACIETKSGDVVEAGFAEGTYWAKFKCTDLGSDDVQYLNVGYRYSDPGDGTAGEILACAEDEALAPNGTFGDATVIDAGTCAEGSGVGIHGIIDAPVFINGDVDFFEVMGLTPGAAYDAVITAGLDGANRFTDTVLGWFVDAGTPVAVDDNSGLRDVYSKLTFTADAGGSAVLAVSGHGDDDFDGHMDMSMAYDEYGHGGYVLMIRLSPPEGEAPLEWRADFNGDGVVDTADLGMLIGVFGASSE